MPSTHTADFQTAALKATDLEAVEKINVGLETELARKQLNIIADAPEIRIQDKTGSASETTMSIVADGGATHFRAGIDTFAEGTETKGNVKFQSSTGATTHAEIVGSSGKLELQDGGLGLKLGSNVSVTGTSKVIQEITGPHARDVVPLRKYPHINFTGHENAFTVGYHATVRSGYVVSASSKYAALSASDAWRAFDGVVDLTSGSGGQSWDSRQNSYASSGTGRASTGITTFNSRNGEWINVKFPHKVLLTSYQHWTRMDRDHEGPYSGYLYGSNDGFSTFQEIHRFAAITLPTTSGGVQYLHTVSSSYTPSGGSAVTLIPYNEYRLQVTHTQESPYLNIALLEFYGYEETSDPDTSVDTKITSQFNLPDTTGVKLYIDGDKGSTPTDFSGEGHTLTDNSESFSGNAWSLTSLSTSNVTMSTGDFAMEGDHPHTVSMWFNAANVSSNATLFHVGTAAGEGDAKTAISLTESGHLGWIDGGDNQFLSANTWHNLVYATQGGGGVRTCYLDGRKLGDVSVQDTFGDYPPFAMSTYSQYGYTVSASTEYPGYNAWEAFDDVTGGSADYWSGSTALYNSSSPYNFTGSGDPYETTVGGTLYTGDWIQIEMPYRIKLDYATFFPRLANRFPRQGVFAGSNDGENWDLIHAFSGLSVATVTDTAIVTNSENNTKVYKYIRLVITHSNGNIYAGADNIKFFGHKENDKTRFPVSSTVLKYPHIPLTNYPDRGGPGRRGYVATSSGAPNPAYDAQHAFNGVTASGEGSWHSMGFYQKASEATPSLAERTPTSSLSSWTANGGSTTGELTTHTGEWVKIQLPHKIILSSIILRQRTGYSAQKVRLFSIVGSNDDTNWFLVHQELTRSGTSSTLQEPDPNTMTGSYASVAFKYFAIVIHAGVTDNIHDHVAIGEWELYGTEEDLDVIARVGEGLDGKVANFRVYDKYLHEEQALELWDAQKDQFGRAESSVVVHKGRLGVGTTEPEGRFAVLDEAGEMGEFPPRAMTAEETYMEGHGVFKASASEYTGAAVHAPWNAFSHGVAEFWLMGQNAGYNLVSGEYEDNEFRLSSETSMGQWIKLEMPYLTNVKNFILKPRTVGAEYQAPKSGELWGSKDNDTWTKLHTFTDIQYHVGHTRFNFENSEFYKYYALVVTKVVGGHSSNDYIGIVDLRFFGTRERGQSTLHDGSLTLTKNLTVPRIGPPLDADDTPRRDRLVVEYNTSTNPTANGVVKDTSGRGLDGLTYNGASYDATEKALVFDGSNDYVFQNDVHLKTGVGGMYSASVWVRNRASSGTHTVYSLGTYAQLTTSTLYVLDTTLQVVFYNSDLNVTYTIPKSTWTNIVVTHGGGATSTTTKMYINGVDVGLAAASGTSYPLSTVNFPSPCNLFLGKNSDNSVYGGPMDLSNFKLWDTELSADDAKRLYDMGRCDEGHHTTHVYKSKLQMRGENLVIEPCIRGFYEEGTWIPLIGGHTSGRKTPNSANYGWFIRVGNMVTIGGTVGWDGGDSTLNGHIVLDGIPYPSRSTTNARAAMSFGVVGSNGITTGSGYNVLRLVLDPGYPYIWFIQANEHGSTTVTYNHNPGVASSGYIYGIGGSYMI